MVRRLTFMRVNGFGGLFRQKRFSECLRHLLDGGRSAIEKVFWREVFCWNPKEADNTSFVRRTVRHLCNGHLRSAFFEIIVVRLYGGPFKLVRADSLPKQSVSG
jgi:hypothetical protein